MPTEITLEQALLVLAQNRSELPILQKVRLDALAVYVRELLEELDAQETTKLFPGGEPFQITSLRQSAHQFLMWTSPPPTPVMPGMIPQG